MFIKQIFSFFIKLVTIQPSVGSEQLLKEIDFLNILSRYTYVNDKGKLSFSKPDVQATILGIDEFKLHYSHKFVTIKVDMNTSYILWVQEGKKKQVVYDFINHVIFLSHRAYVWV